MSMPQYREYSIPLTEMKNFAGEIAYLCDTLNIPIILLYGEMGSGKTTFINTFVSLYTQQNTVASPTYSYLNYYQLSADKQLVHIDLYRVHDVTDVMETFGIEEFLFLKKGMVAIEWPDKLKVVWEQKIMQLHFYYDEQLDKRKIIIQY